MNDSPNVVTVCLNNLGVNKVPVLIKQTTNNRLHSCPILIKSGALLHYIQNSTNVRLCESFQCKN